MVKCNYFGECGGCSSQHVEYAGQLEFKKKLLERSIGFSGIQIFHGREFGYRNRMQLS